MNHITFACGADRGHEPRSITDEPVLRPGQMTRWIRAFSNGVEFASATAILVDRGDSRLVDGYAKMLDFCFTCTVRAGGTLEVFGSRQQPGPRALHDGAVLLEIAQMLMNTRCTLRDGDQSGWVSGTQAAVDAMQRAIELSDPEDPS